MQQIRKLYEELQLGRGKEERLKLDLIKTARLNAELQSELEKMIKNGDTTDNGIRDMVIVCHRSIDQRIESFYRQIQEKIAQAVGQLVLFTYQDEGESNSDSWYHSDGDPSCFRAPPHEPIKMYMLMGRLSGKKLVWTGNHISLPTNDLYISCHTEPENSYHAHGKGVVAHPQNLPLDVVRVDEIVFRNDRGYEIETTNLLIGHTEVESWLKKHPSLTGEIVKHKSLWTEMLLLLDKPHLNDVHEGI